MLPTGLIDRDVSSSVTRSIKGSNIQNMPLYCLVLGVGSVGNILFGVRCWQFWQHLKSVRADRKTSLKNFPRELTLKSLN